ncbi:MAG: DUF1564 family protein [Leptospiraceae bacterium]|nr:DUF1564 family protein [Leptospiraceae bacterium]
MPELLQDNSYKIQGEGTLVFTLNMGTNARRLFRRKLIRCKTHAQAMQELLDRYETASWSGMILKPNANMKTKYQVKATESEVVEENYKIQTIRVFSRDYLRLKTLANFLRISMSLLFAFMLSFDETNAMQFHRMVKRSLALAKNFSFSTKIRFFNGLDLVELFVKTPLGRGS